MVGRFLRVCRGHGTTTSRNRAPGPIKEYVAPVSVRGACASLASGAGIHSTTTSCSRHTYLSLLCQLSCGVTSAYGRRMGSCEKQRTITVTGDGLNESSMSDVLHQPQLFFGVSLQHVTLLQSSAPHQHFPLTRACACDRGNWSRGGVLSPAAAMSDACDTKKRFLLSSTSHRLSRSPPLQRQWSLRGRLREVCHTSSSQGRHASRSGRVQR